MITEQTYGINLFQFAEAFLLVSCRVLFYTERSSELFLFRQFVSIFVPRNGVPSCFFFRGRVRSWILRVCFYFCSTERNSDFFSFRRKGSERNSERFLFRGTAVIQSEMIICCVYSIFHGIIFLSEIPNPSHYYLLLVFPSVLISLLLLVDPAVPVFSCSADGQSGNVFLLLLFFHWSPWYS